MVSKSFNITISLLKQIIGHDIPEYPIYIDKKSLRMNISIVFMIND